MNTDLATVDVLYSSFTEEEIDLVLVLEGADKVRLWRRTRGSEMRDLVGSEGGWRTGGTV